MECPFINREVVPDPRFNKTKEYERRDGKGGPYIYYEHCDDFGAERPCQFCQLIGRKYDIFECFNESEWRQCGHYLFKITLDKTK